MPAFEARLPAEDRWAVALYASTLRLPAAAGTVARFAPRVRRERADVRRTAPGCPGHAARQLRGRAGAASRRCAPLPREPTSPPARCSTRSGRRSSPPTPSREAGDPGAGPKALDAYMTFEQVEREVRAKNPSLAADLEAEFAALRTQAASPEPSELDPGARAARRRARERRAYAERRGLAGQPLRPVVHHHAARGAGGDPRRRRADDLPGQDGRVRPPARHQPRRRRGGGGQPAHRAWRWRR